MSTRAVIVPGDQEKTLQFAIEEWVKSANESISRQGHFAVALSGGSTPKAIYAGLTQYKDAIDWSKVLLFWSDERNVPSNHPESNYSMAMEFLGVLPILQNNIFAMKGTGDLEVNARDYEKLIQDHIGTFDLMMLGMGEDGHTASLFPKTHGLHTLGRIVIANFVPQKDTWRLSVTFDCINQSKKINVYVLGEAKADMIKKVFNESCDSDILPVQRVGTEPNPALFILDEAAAQRIK